jgi:hypothetical protein
VHARVRRRQERVAQALHSPGQRVARRATDVTAVGGLGCSMARHKAKHALCVFKNAPCASILQGLSGMARVTPCWRCGAGGAV